MSTIAPDAWRRLRLLLDRALSMDPDARAGFVAALEGDDAVLRPELARLLEEHARLADKSLPNAMELAVPALHEELASISKRTKLA